MFEQFADAVDETARTGKIPDFGTGANALAVGVSATRDAGRRLVARQPTALRERLARHRPLTARTAPPGTGKGPPGGAGARFDLRFSSRR